MEIVVLNIILISIGATGIDWLGTVWGWLLLAATSLLLLIGFQSIFSVRAGADWAAWGRRWVKVYELTEINVDDDKMLHLKDRDNRKLSVYLSNICSTGRLWDLAYNGILHSAQLEGTICNERAEDYLFLDKAGVLTLYGDRKEGVTVEVDPEVAPTELSESSPVEGEVSMSDPPPRPDPVTGQPRPPQAPFVGNWWMPNIRPARRATNRSREAPESPLGEGPAIEWVGRSPRTLVAIAMGLFLVVIAILCAATGGLDWMRVWWAWPVAAVVAAVAALPLWQPSDRAAGADWFRYNGAWVRLYQLSDVRLRKRWNGTRLELTDTAGRRVRISSGRVQENRELWALVYNGILHWAYQESADIDPYTHLELQLTSMIVAGQDGPPDE